MIRREAKYHDRREYYKFVIVFDYTKWDYDATVIEKLLLLLLLLLEIIIENFASGDEIIKYGRSYRSMSRIVAHTFDSSRIYGIKMIEDY